MKKFYLFSTLLIFVLLGNAQVNLLPINSHVINQPFQYNGVKDATNKTAGCVDIISYPQGKATAWLSDTMDYTTYIGGIAQAYYFSGTGFVNGISTYMLLDLDGVPGNSDSVSMVISVRNINAGNVPTSIIASDTVFLHDVGYFEQQLMFTSPVAVSDSFAVVIEIDTLNPSNPYYITNDYGNGLAEALSSLSYAGVWYNLYPTWSGTWDVDMIISPIFEQDFTSAYTVDIDSVCLGNTVTFTNTTPTDVNTMFFTSPNSYSLNLGDLTIIAPFDTNYTHLYTASGTYATELTATNYGYLANCVDVVAINVTVFDTAIANFGWTDMGGGNFQFSDSSFSITGINSWLWDFGDGTTSTIQNPLITYPTPGDYYVCLAVSDSNGCNTNVFCDSVFFTVGVAEVKASNSIRIFPIPATKYFSVAVPSNYYNGEIVITDIVGKKLKVVPIENQEKVKILTTDIVSGVYFVSIDYGGERVFTKRIMIDK
ncbi:MAG: hypothetical protein CO118_04690 [Flavobacteriales bacterium CG_4_9_14_3_um_filter_32_8]|nr:MAG: hypothetical protein CO118_04690 [Flavobacteriales bacterium CG_4_9_14_3_um_filter_32_8]